jgi:hypothetical protein
MDKAFKSSCKDNGSYPFCNAKANRKEPVLFWGCFEKNSPNVDLRLHIGKNAFGLF